MATYKYSALSKDGKKVSGVVEAYNDMDAAAKIKDYFQIIAHFWRKMCNIRFKDSFPTLSA